MLGFCSAAMWCATLLLPTETMVAQMPAEELWLLLLAVCSHALFSCTILGRRVVYSKLPYYSLFVLMSFHFIRHEFSPLIRVHNLYDIASLGIDVSLIMLVQFKGLTLFLLEVQLCLACGIIYLGCYIVMAIQALYRCRSP